MTKTVQEFLNRRAAYYGEPTLSVDDLPEWQQREVEKALTYEAPGNIKHVSSSLRMGSSKVACGTNLSHQRSTDTVDPWTFEMMFGEGREDLCLSCMRRQRKMWSGIDRPAYCTERDFGLTQPASSLMAA